MPEFIHMIRTRLAACILAIVLCGTMNARDYLPTILNTGNGLCNNTVFCVQQDADGYLWFGTDDGLVRYDGVNFIRIGKEDGLRGNFITAIKQYKKDSLALICYREGIQFIDIHTFKPGKLWIKSSYSNDVLVYRNKFYTTNRSRFSVFFPLGDSIHEDPFWERYAGNILLYSYLLEQDTLYANTSDGMLCVHDKNTVSYACPLLRHQKVFYTIYDHRHDLIACIPGHILRIRDQRIIRDYHEGIDPGMEFNDLMIDHENTLWAVGRTKDLYRIKDDRIEELSKETGILNLVVSKIFEDRDQNIWLTTLGNGIVQLRPNPFTQYKAENANLNLNITRLLLDKEDQLLVGSLVGLNQFVPESGTLRSVPGYLTLPGDAGIRFLIPGPDRSVLTNDYLNTLYFREGKQLSKPLNPTLRAIAKQQLNIHCLPFYWAFPLQEVNHYLVVGYRGEGMAEIVYNPVSKQWRLQRIIDTHHLFYGITTLDMSYWQGRYYFCCDHGLFSFDGYNTFIRLPLPEKKARFYRLRDSGKHTLLLATDKGIWEYNGRSYTHAIRLGNDIPGHICTSMQIDQDGRLWAGTMNGLYCIDPSGRQQLFKTDNGLPNNSISDLCFDSLHSKIWIGTQNGLASISSRFHASSSPSSLLVHIESAWVHDRILFLSGQHLKPGQNTITLHLSTPYYKPAHFLRYQYRIHEHDPFSETNESQLRFNALSSGSYDIEIRAHDLETDSYGPIARFGFILDSPLYTRWWFQLSMVFLVLAFVLFFVALLLWRERTRINLQKELAISRHQTHSASINPHFIFNALNSVQYFMNLNDRLSANRYLTNFAKLIRRNFNATKQLEITLEEEIEALQIYLNLEQMRQPDRFDYEISIDEQLAVDQVRVPVMILQPYLENSILHGFQGSAIKGMIIISFAKTKDGLLEICLSDNGIGVRQKKEERNNHQSSGMDLTRQRLALYAKINGIRYSLETGPLNPLEENNPGHMVRIRLPLPD